MEIFIEDFILQNSLINFCLLKLVELTTKSKTNLFKLILSAIIASSFSILAVLVINNVILLNIIKLICSFMMLLIAYHQTLKQFIFNFILLFIYTYAFGGAIIGLFGINHYTNFGYVTSTNISLSSVCLIIISFTYIFKYASKHISFLMKSNNLIYKIKLYKGNHILKINAYLDTGNLLNYNGKPVIVLDVESFCKLNKISLIDFYLLKSEHIKTNTVNGCSHLKLFKLDQLKIINHHKSLTIANPYVAINIMANFKNTNYQALLNPMLF